MGRTTLGPLLSVLGVMILIVEDPDAVKRISDSGVKRRAVKRVLEPVTHGLGNLPEIRTIRAQALQEALKKNARKGGLIGGKARAQKLSRAQLRRIARKAARARWRRRKQVRIARALARSEAETVPVD